YAGSAALATNAETLKKRLEALEDALRSPNESVLDFGGGVKLELVLIPAGEFEMGGDEEANEKPVHKVKITRPYYMGKYVVTQAQYSKIVGANLSVKNS